MVNQDEYKIRQTLFKQRVSDGMEFRLQAVCIFDWKKKKKMMMKMMMMMMKMMTLLLLLVVVITFADYTSGIKVCILDLDLHLWYWELTLTGAPETHSFTDSL